MTRQLESWATSNRRSSRPRLTWFKDMAGFAGTLFGLRNKRPLTAPERDPQVRDRLGTTDVRFRPNLFNSLVWRVQYQVAGLDALRGLEAPLIIATNEAGALDWQALKPILPRRLRATTRVSSRALARGESLVLFTEDPVVDGEVGEFSTLVAELANQHNVPIVPVALVGTFKLAEVLRLSLRTKPRVSIRFGAPIYVRGRSFEDATAEVQASVEQLSGSGDLSWWATQHPVPRAEVSATPTPRWRRLWQQTAPRRSQRRPRIWR